MVYAKLSWCIIHMQVYYLLTVLPDVSFPAAGAAVVCHSAVLNNQKQVATQTAHIERILTEQIM
jgi:hypothetical protein